MVFDSPAFDSPSFDSSTFDSGDLDARDFLSPGPGARGVEDEIESAARIVAREALSAGIQISFSPVADVHSNPNNPIISTRAFGTDPSTVARRARAYIRGCHGVGLLSTAKHFPGHGDTESDSHTEVPVVNKSIHDLERTEFLPFSEAISEGVDLVMTAHVAFPSIDPTGAIATSSSEVLTALLRNSMGFKGVIITDSLLMAGAGNEIDGSGYAQMIRAGVDILLDVAEPRTVISQLEEEVRTGRLAEDIVYQSFERVWALKNRLLDRFGPSIFTDPDGMVTVTAEERVCHQLVADKIASRACHIRSGSISDVRLSRDGMCIVHVCPRPGYSDPTVGSVESMFSGAFDGLSFFSAFPDLIDESDFSEEILGCARQASGVVIMITAKPAAWQKFGITSSQALLITALLDLPGCVLAFTGFPVGEIDEESAALSLCLYSDTSPSLRALVLILSDIVDRTA